MLVELRQPYSFKRLTPFFPFSLTSDVRVVFDPTQAEFVFGYEQVDLRNCRRMKTLLCGTTI